MRKIRVVFTAGILLMIFFITILVEEGQAGKLLQTVPSAALTPTDEISYAQPDSDPAAVNLLKSLFFLVCGLGVVAGIVIMVLLTVRSAAKKTEPPSPPDSTR